MDLKLEKRDHEITKRELEQVKQEFDDYKEMVDKRLAEIKSIHLVEKEHLRNRLQLSQIKLQDLQIQYDDLLQKTLN